MEKIPGPEELEILSHEGIRGYKVALWILFVIASLYLIFSFSGGMP